MKIAFICFFFSLAIPFSWNRSFASSRAAGPTSPLSTEISRILSVLEDKMESPELRLKIEHKLSTLDHKQILLIASLSERIANENRTTGKEIAILMITALIVFS